MELTGKYALVTGGEAGIGYEYVKELLRNGVQKVCIAGLDKIKGDAAVETFTEEFGKDHVIFYKTDVSKANELEDVFNHLISNWEQLDIVINNAGIADDINWDRMIDVNIKGVIKGSLLAYNYMNKQNGGKGGTIVNISSLAGLHPFWIMPCYAATKYAVLGFSRSLAMNYEQSGVSVMTMCPGVTFTALVTSLTASATATVDEVKEEFAQHPTQGPEDVAKAIIHLLKHGSNGGIWVSAGKEPTYALELPYWGTFKKCNQ